MDRLRRAARAALALAIALGLVGTPPGGGRWPLATVAAAEAAWPTSSLVVSEVQTGGASASDEFVEIANQGAWPVDLMGLEVVYATSSGSTVTRKATWADSTVLEPGRRILVANGAGSYAGPADALYSGGFAATGGAVALRVVGGSVVDAIGWGDATNAFVEGIAAVAPAAGSSLERRPGGTSGNGMDTNDNATDFVAATPSPQSLAAQPVPAPTPTVAPTPTAPPSPTAPPTPTAEPTVAPTPTAGTTPTAAPTPSPESTAQPTPSPDPTPSLEPTAPPPTPIAISAARALPDDARVLVEGVLTTDLGALEGGRTAFIQDETAGIAIYLDGPVVGAWPLGTRIRATGAIDTRYAQRTLRAGEADLVDLGQGIVPAALQTTTGGAAEDVEGRRLAVEGTVAGSTDELADGFAVSVDDGTGPVRVVVTPGALGSRSLPTGGTVRAIGPLGQRDSAGTGLAGYRVYVTVADDLVVTTIPVPTPAPTATPIPTATAGPTATPPASSTPTPGPTGTPSPPPLSITAVRDLPVGTVVTVTGVVTAESGRLGTPPLLAIADASGGIVVRVPSGVAAPPRGARITVHGPLADPYGQLEIRPPSSGLTTDGVGPLPIPVGVGSTGLGEATEARLARTSGIVVVKPSRATSGDISLDIETAAGRRLRIFADASSGVTAAAFTVGATYDLTGIGGQRASRKGALDGYRLWVRDLADVVLLRAPSPSATPGPKSTTKPSASLVSIATALRTTDREVAIDAIVTAGAALLDTTGRRIVIQDASGAVEVLLPKDATAPKVGSRVRAVGRMGTAYGAPRLRAVTVDRQGSGAVPSPLEVRGALAAAHTWRLVMASGRIAEVRKLGDRWRAEVLVGRDRVVVVGQPGAGIPVSTLQVGRDLRVIGIVRPAHPTATDRRASLLPRSAADVRVSGSASTATGMGGSTPPGGGAMNAGPTGVASASGADGGLIDVPEADLADLAGHVGLTVRVGGLVTELTSDGFRLDDGTAIGRVAMTDDAATLLPLVEPGDAINVIGRVEKVDGDALAVIVSEPGAVALGSDPVPGTEEAVAVGPRASASSTPGDAPARSAGFGDAIPSLPGVAPGLLGLLLVILASVAITALRRRHARRLLAVRVAGRLAAMAGPGPNEVVGRGASVGHAP